MDATQRGRFSLLQVCFARSITSNAVVFASTVTGLSVGAAGAFTPAQSSTMLPACAGSIDIVKAARAAAMIERFIFVSPCGRVRPLIVGKPCIRCKAAHRASA